MKKHIFLKKEKHAIKAKASRDYHLKRRKKILKKFYFWFTFVIILSLFYFCFYSEFFAIKQIEIVKEQNSKEKVSDQQVRNNIFSIFSKNKFLIFSQRNFLVFDKKSAIEKITESQHIEKVSIKKIFPDKLKITVEEKISVANLALLEKDFGDENENEDEEGEQKKEKNYKYYLIDKKGDILEEIGEIDYQLPLIYDQREIPQYPYLSQEKLAFILDLWKKFPQRIKGIDIISFEIGESEKFKLTVVTSESWQIYFDFNQDVRNQLEKLFLILQEKVKEQIGVLQYIDLRFEDRVYYK